MLHMTKKTTGDSIARVCCLLAVTAIMFGTIAAKDYCESAGGCDEYISRVTFVEIDNPSLCVGYSDFTSQVATLEMGKDYLITIEVSEAYSSDSGAVWIDWKRNIDFDEAYDKVQLDVCGGYGPYYGTVRVPDSIGPEVTVMRVRLCYNQTPHMCGITQFGEVEDYLVQIVEPAYVCGDANGDESINVADAVAIINYVFKGGPAPDPLGAGDPNCDGEVNVADAVYMINYVFLGGPEPCCP